VFSRPKRRNLPGNAHESGRLLIALPDFNLFIACPNDATLPLYGLDVMAALI
jgi:hypothetical protein